MREVERDGQPRIVVAPNGVDVPERIPGREVVERKFPRLKGKEWVLFMSRIHPKKGLDVLLEAWKQQMAAAPSGLGLRLGLSEVTGGGSRVTGNDPSSISQTPSATRTPVLVIAGADLIGYGAEVEKMIREKGLGERGWFYRRGAEDAEVFFGAGGKRAWIKIKMKMKGEEQRNSRPVS